MEKFIFIELSFQEIQGDQVSSFQVKVTLAEDLAAKVEKLKGKTRLEAFTLLGEYGFQPVLRTVHTQTGVTVITMMKQTSR